MNISEIRKKYPEYADLSDMDIARGLHAKHYSDMGFGDFAGRIGLGYGEPIQKDGQYQVGGPATVDVGEIPAAVVEPALTQGSAAIAAPVGTIGGGIQAIIEPAIAKWQGRYQNPLAGPQARDRITERLTYEPRSEEGQRVVGRYNELAEEYVAPVVESARLGDEVLEMGGPEWLAKNAEAIPEYIMAGLAALGLRPRAAAGATDKYGNIKPSMDRKAIIREQLRNKTGRSDTAKYDLYPYGSKRGLQVSPSDSGAGGTLIKSKPASAALNQGWDEISVAGVKAADSATKGKIRNMINIARNRTTERTTAETKIRTRPSDIAGDSLDQRYRFISKANKSSGSLLGKIADDLGAKGTRIDVNRALTSLQDDFAQHGIKYTLKNGKVRMDFSDLDLPKTDRAMLTENVEQLSRYLSKVENGTMNFADAHKLKQIMRQTGISYEKTIAKTGASPAAQNIFKRFSSKIDEAMDNTSTAYDKQNTKFAETRDAMTAVEKIAKDNLFGDSPEATLGTLGRRLMGNPVSRRSVINYTQKLDEISNKYGGNFQDDLFLQTYIASEMDRVIEIAAKLSFKGETASAVASGMNQSMPGKIATGVDAAKRFAFRQSPEKALNTLQMLASD